MRKYIVIVGNRRVAYCKILNNPELANVKNKRINNRVGEFEMEYAPQVIPAFVFYKREGILLEVDYKLGPAMVERFVSMIGLIILSCN